MRLKGFFWTLTFLMIVICLYQLSFTWVAQNIESDAAATATEEANKLKEESKLTGDSAQLPNGVWVHFDRPEGFDIAKSAFLNDILKKKSDNNEESFLGNNYAAIKKRSLSFGLDLVGGMSVTLEVSVPELIKSKASDPNENNFSSALKKATYRFKDGEDDLFKLFVEEFKKVSNQKLNEVFVGNKFEGKSDDEIIGIFQETIDNSIDNIETVMENRINQFGVAQPNIEKDIANNRLYIELPGVLDEATVSKKLKSTANLEFYELYAVSEIYDLLLDADRASREESLTADTTEEESLSLDMNVSSEKGILDYLEGEIKNDQSMAQTLGYVLPENKYAIDKLMSKSEVSSVISSAPFEVKFMWSAKPELVDQKKSIKAYFLYACKVPIDREPLVSGEDIAKASQGYDQTNGKITVDLEMSDEGADKWSQLTGSNINKLVAITMDNLVFSAPVVNGVLSKNSQISGSFTFEEAEDLTALLNGGALPVPLEIVDLTKVGPTIGKENSRAGLISFGIALLVVFAYMVFYYGKAGLVADIALLANMVFIFGSLAAFHATLTLAGIAGIVLTIGMAVDANVLIFERVREEQRNGKDLRSSINTGFSKALSSIIDANLTTLLTAIVLKIFGTGPIESFATTLIIGIFSSLFAAVVISRLVFEFMLSRNNKITFGSKLTNNMWSKVNFNFIDKRKPAYIISVILFGLSLFMIFSKGINQSVEFTGGRTYSVTFEKPVSNDIEHIKEKLLEQMPNSSVEVKTKTVSTMIEIKTNYLLEEDDSDQKVIDALITGLENCDKELGKATLDTQNTRKVTSNVASKLKTSALVSMSLALLLIFLYIFLRFGKWQFSLSAIIALFHDVVIVLGIFSIFNGILPFNMDMDQALVAALLTVVGYSINDTVVVFDRIREELSWKSDSDYKSEINGALNSTLSRTINTSMTTFIVLLIIFLFGGAAIKGFIFALLIGIMVGTYSSMFVATPLLVDLTKKIKIK